MLVVDLQVEVVGLLGLDAQREEVADLQLLALGAQLKKVADPQRLALDALFVAIANLRAQEHQVELALAALAILLGV